MKVVKFIFSVLIIFLYNNSYAQFSKGMLKMEVNGIKMNGEEAGPQIAGHLGSMEVSIFSDGVIQKSVTNMMMMKTTSIIDTKLDSIFIYMDMMGKKYRIPEKRMSSLEEANETVKAMQENMEIKEFPEDTKEILGYKCHRVILKMKIPAEKSKTEESQEVTIKMYVTNELKFDPSFITQTSKKINLNGTPLEYNMNMGAGSFQIEISMLAKEFKKDVDPNDLLAPAGTFKNVSMDEFQKEMAGMRK